MRRGCLFWLLVSVVLSVTLTVLVEPRWGTAVRSPFTVSGYSRNPEATNSVALERFS